MPRRPLNIHHQTELVIGGAPVAPPKCKRCDAVLPGHVDGCTLKLIVIPQDFTLDASVPSTRADCPEPVNEYGVRRFGYPNEQRHRMCPHYHCRHNLWHVAGEDRPGRRWKEGELPPETNQLHFDVTGGQGPRARDSEPSENDVRLWTGDNCALDRLEQQKFIRDDRGFPEYVPMTHKEVAAAVGDMTERQVRRVVRKFMAKLKRDEGARELFELKTER